MSSTTSATASAAAATASAATARAYLELIIGPMFSGKTSRLVDIYKQCKFCNITVAVINHCIDARYHDTLLSTHDKVMIPCIKTDNLKSVLTNITDAQVVIINEGQFFNDLYEVVLQMIHLKKKIYIGGTLYDLSNKTDKQLSLLWEQSGEFSIWRNVFLEEDIEKEFFSHKPENITESEFFESEIKKVVRKKRK